MAALQIYDPGERRLVAAADRALSTVSAVRSLWRPTSPDLSPRRILLLRLERIGDLLMVLPALSDVRELAPDAEIDLVVGSWNVPLARTISAVTRVVPVDAHWLARGPSGQSLSKLLRQALSWRQRRYDLAINFEPDIRSNLLLAASGASFAAGYATGGGGGLLDRAIEYDPRAHTSDNARALVAAVFGRRAIGRSGPTLTIPESARREAARRLPRSLSRPLVGVHVSGGRAIKQWEPDRFGEVARRLAKAYGAAIVLTGSPEDAALVATLRSSLRDCRVIDVSGDADLPYSGRDPRTSRCVRHRRHRTDAPGRRCRDTGCRDIRSFGSRQVRASRTARSCRTRRSAVQPVQSDPPSTGAMCGPHA